MQPSLYAQFAKEVHGINCLEREWGFATYELGPDYVYIMDIYVVPALRSAKKGVELMHDIGALAKAQGATHMFGSINELSAEPLKNYNMLRHLGFQDSHKDGTLYYLVREI